MSPVIGPDGKPVHGPDGKVLKQSICMADGFFDGKPQYLYFPEEHSHAGQSRSME